MKIGFYFDEFVKLITRGKGHLEYKKYYPVSMSLH